MSDKPKLMERIRDSKFAEFVREKVKPVAGDVLEIVGDITGRESIEKVGQYLNRNKESNEQIRALDAEFQMKKLEWEMELEQIRVNAAMEEMRLQVQDRENARSREIEYIKSTGKRDWLMGTVVITGLLLTVGVIACLVFVKIPEENQRLADMSFGSVLSIGASIFAYYVGSSKSSRSKDETISKVIK